MDNKLCRFLLVNEEDIKKSDLFKSELEIKKESLDDLYNRAKKEHAGILFFLNYAEDLLKKESEKIPGRIERATRELDRIRSRHIDSIAKIGKMQHVSDQFLKMSINMYAMYELEACSQVEFSILEGLFNSIEKTRPSLNDDLKGLLEQYKAIYEYEKAIDYDKDLKEKVNIAIKQIKSLHKNYIKTLGFEEKYIKKQHRELIKEICRQVKEMFNLLCASGKNISALVIIDEMCKSEFQNKTNAFVRTDLLSNFRLHGDGVYLQKFTQYVNDATLDKDVDPKTEDIIKAVRELGSQLLLKYKRTIGRMKNEGISLGVELDLTSELIKVDKIIKEYYEMKSLEEIEDEILKKQGIQKKDNEYEFEKEMQTKDVDLSENGETDYKKPSMLVLRDLNDVEKESYFRELRKLQINKVKNIADEIVVMQKYTDFVSEYYMKEQGVKHKEILGIFEKLDCNVSNVYGSYVSKRLEMIDASNEQKQNIHYVQILKKFERIYNRITESYDLYEGREPQKTALVAVAKKVAGVKVQKLEPLEEKLGIYEALFSAEPNGIDLDERIKEYTGFSEESDEVNMDEIDEERNNFYACLFNESIGIMTFPYANISEEVQKSKFSRAAIIYDREDYERIVCRRRGASWASDANDRIDKEIKGIKRKIYSGNRMVINNRTHFLLDVIAKEAFGTKDYKEKLEEKKNFYMSGHKFDYRRKNIKIYEPEKSNESNKPNYYSVNDVAWISDDTIDISKFKAICYMDTAENLKTFIEELG